MHISHLLDMRLSADLAIQGHDETRAETLRPYFCAFVMTKGNSLLCSTYAPDFGSDWPRDIMLVSTMSMKLEMSELVGAGCQRLGKFTDQILPLIGPGYAGASLQDVLNMNVVNDYEEDRADL